MSLVQMIRTALVTHEQGHINTKEAIDIVMDHVVENYIPNFNIGGEFMVVPYGKINVFIAKESNEKHDIFFYCEDGRVLYADTDEQTWKKGAVNNG